MRILITGASAGLGAEMARQFADRGHDLVLTARRVDRLEQLREEILAKHPGRRIDVAALDVTTTTRCSASSRSRRRSTGWWSTPASARANP
jgi:short-subunit dehydrogenase